MPGTVLIIGDTKMEVPALQDLRLLQEGIICYNGRIISCRIIKVENIILWKLFFISHKTALMLIKRIKVN